MKVKFFSITGQSSQTKDIISELEEELNKWLKENDDIDISYIKHSQSGGEHIHFVVIAVYYN